jgi:hypothetical protein
MWAMFLFNVPKVHSGRLEMLWLQVSVLLNRAGLENDGSVSSL